MSIKKNTHNFSILKQEATNEIIIDSKNKLRNCKNVNMSILFIITKFNEDLEIKTPN